MSEHGSGAGHRHDHGPEVRSLDLARPGTKTRVLAIASGKGGVGKSSVAVNLAATFARRGFVVSILDADVYGFSIPQMLGVTVAPEVVDHHVLVPPISHGVGCISMGFFVEDEEPLMWRGPMLHKALNQFLVDVQWGEPDFLIVDMPPGTGDVALSMAQLLPAAETYVVTTPQPAAQRVAQRSGAMARESRVPLMGVIENMSGYVDANGAEQQLFGAGGGQALAQQLEVPLLAQIPLNQALREGGDSGVPVVVSDPESVVALAFVGLVDQILSLRPPRIFRDELKVV